MMKKESKYSAHAFFYRPDINQIYSRLEADELSVSEREKLIFFASKHEFSVYKALLTWGRECFIEVHLGIEIIAPNTISTYPQGKKWAVDFALRNKSNLAVVALIEAKGTVTKDFPLTLALLELHNKELFEKLWLVFPSKIPSQKTFIKNLMKACPERIVSLPRLMQHVSAMSENMSSL